METKYQSRHVQTLYKVSNETVRTWSEEFAKHLSPTANPGSGKHRHFTEDDLAVFALISEMKAQGSTYADIHLSLENDQRGEVPQFSTHEMIAVASSQQSLALAMRLEELEVTVVKLEKERGEALVALRIKEDELISLRATHSISEKRLTELAEQLEKAQAEIKELSREIGTAYSKGILDALREKGDLPKKE